MPPTPVNLTDVCDVDTLRVVVGIKLVGPNQRHVILAHRSSAQVAFATLHLSGNFQPLEAADASPAYLYFAPAISVQDQLVLAGACRRIARTNKKGVPYGFSLPLGVFREDGSLMENQEWIGLTCATFVVAVFGFAGIDLLDFDGWPVRNDDLAWQEKVIRWLQQSNAPQAQIEHLMAQRGNLRIRPEEAAAGATAESMPNTFHRLSPLIHAILELTAAPS